MGAGSGSHFIGGPERAGVVRSTEPVERTLSVRDIFDDFDRTFRTVVPNMDFIGIGGWVVTPRRDEEGKITTLSGNDGAEALPQFFQLSEDEAYCIYRDFEHPKPLRGKEAVAAISLKLTGLLKPAKDAAAESQIAAAYYPNGISLSSSGQPD